MSKSGSDKGTLSDCLINRHYITAINAGEPRESWMVQQNQNRPGERSESGDAVIG